MIVLLNYTNTKNVINAEKQCRQIKGRQQEEEAGLVDSNDKSGADPINFTFDARLYNEYQWLTAPGNAGRNITSFDLRSPSTDRGRQMAGPGELGDSSRRRSRGDRQVCQPGPAEEVEIREAAVVGGALDFAKAKANGKQQQQQGDARS